MNRSSVPATRGQIFLLGSYADDNFLSMQKFSKLMRDELSRRGYQVVLSVAPLLFGRLCPRSWRLRKWLGHIDKYLIYPVLLRWRSRAAAIVHICDHSSANYVHILLGGAPTLVTCHDLLAVRGALGEDTDCQPSWTGKVLQHWILSGLRQADCIACVSSFTRDDARRIIGDRPDFRLPVVLNGLNYPYQQLTEDLVRQRLQPWWEELNRRPFVFQLGSNHERKNRLGALRTFAAFSKTQDATLVFAGQPLNQPALELAASLGIRDRILDLGRTSDAVVEALYNRAHALLFPSHHEGFGWPVVEAQACGCPVVCSDILPFREIAGSSALLCPADDAQGMATCLQNLLCSENRQLVVAGTGLKNAERFTTSRMIDDYLGLYDALTRKTMEAAEALA